MDKDVYRAVPFRFVIDEANADICKLEKLTNLFPEMKMILGLELFKFNNLTQTINRLSGVFTVTSAIDTRDDTLHLFLGPYHLTMGPVTFGAMQFRNLSTALLASSHSKAANDGTTPYQKRRHDAALRRFRRAVRKLIYIKSIIDKLRLASILTPYNQYKLYQRGIYDLVLAGHLHSSDSIFTDEDFLDQMKNFHSKTNFDDKTPLLASKFTKISTLLHLLSPSPNQTENNSTPGKLPPARTDDTNNFTSNENSSKSLLNSANLCCTNHFQNSQHAMIPINRSITYQSTHFYKPESPSKRNSKHNSRRHSLNPPGELITESLPDLTSGDKFSTSTSDKSKDLVPVKSNNQEDAFVNRISSLLTNYLLSTTINTNHDHTDSSVPQTISVASHDHSSTIEPKEFDKILQRIKTVVDKNLSDHPQTSTPNHKKSSTKRSKASVNKHKPRLSSKAQSLSEINTQSHPTKPESNDHSIEL